LKKLIFAVVFILTIICATAYANEINPGDFIKMGSYNGSPIIWRCLESEEGRALMMSDSIITLKAFDAAGDAENDTYGFRTENGSNLWSDSTLRAWLNSDSDNVSYSGSVPNKNNVTENPYNTERGFLCSFSKSEKEVILDSEITTVINTCDLSRKSGGTAEHILNSNISDVLANYTESYVQTTTDRFFLPSVADVHNINTNVYIFSPLYEIAYPTNEAVMYSELKFPDMDLYDTWNYWLRDAVSYAQNSNLVRIVSKSGTVDYDSANNGVMGVRPMFYINTEKATFLNGTGTRNSPYSVRSGSWVEISDGDFSAEAGIGFALDVYCEGVENCEFKVYADGNLLDCSYDNIILPEGIYDITVAAVENGEILSMSDSVNVTVIEYTVDSLMLDTGFEGSNAYSGFAGYGTKGGSFEVIEDSEGKHLKMTSHPSGYADGTAPYLILPKVADNTEIIMISYDLKFTKDVSHSIFSLKFRPSANWLRTISYELTGKIVFKDYNGNKHVLKNDIALGEWHNYKLVYNIAESKATVFIDNKSQLVNENVCFNEFTLDYCNVSSSSADNVIYVDNMRQAVVKENAIYSVSYEKNGTTIMYADGENGTEGFRYAGFKEGSISNVYDSEEHGNVIKLTTVGNGGNSPYLLSPFISGLSNEVLLQADFKFPDAGKMSANILSVKTLPDSKWLYLLAVNTSGEIVLKGTTGSERVVVEKVDPNKWYRIRIIYNKSSHTATVSINDEIYTKVNLAFTDYEDFNYMNINAGTLYDGSEASMFVDNVRVSHSEAFVSPYETNIIRVMDPCNILSGYKLITAAYRGNRLNALDVTEISGSGKYIAELEAARGDETLKTFIVDNLESLRGIAMKNE